MYSLCNTYRMVGRSIADIYERGAYIFTEAQYAKVIISAEVICRGYGPTLLYYILNLFKRPLSQFLKISILIVLYETSSLIPISMSFASQSGRYKGAKLQKDQLCVGVSDFPD